MGIALPVAPAQVTTVQSSLLQDSGTVENAGGIHPLGVTWRQGLTLSAKPGATTAADGVSVSWLVGRLTVDGRHHVFASAAWRAAGAVDALEGAGVASRAFVARGLLPAP